MMKGITLVMNGSLWVTKDAPGAAEYRGYQKAMASADLAAAAMGATGVSMPGMDKLAKAMTSVDGLPVLTEMSMKIEGPAGDQRVDMMQQMMGGDEGHDQGALGQDRRHRRRRVPGAGRLPGDQIARLKATSFSSVISSIA